MNTTKSSVRVCFDITDCFLREKPFLSKKEVNIEVKTTRKKKLYIAQILHKKPKPKNTYVSFQAKLSVFSFR